MAGASLADEAASLRVADASLADEAAPLLEIDASIRVSAASILLSVLKLHHKTLVSLFGALVSLCLTPD